MVKAFEDRGLKTEAENVKKAAEAALKALNPSAGGRLRRWRRGSPRRWRRLSG
jgi:hypothetical protein